MTGDPSSRAKIRSTPDGGARSHRSRQRVTGQLVRGGGLSVPAVSRPGGPARDATTSTARMAGSATENRAAAAPTRPLAPCACTCPPPHAGSTTQGGPQRPGWGSSTPATDSPDAWSAAHSWPQESSAGITADADAPTDATVASSTATTTAEHRDTMRGNMPRKVATASWPPKREESRRTSRTAATSREPPRLSRSGRHGRRSSPSVLGSPSRPGRTWWGCNRP